MKEVTLIAKVVSKPSSHTKKKSRTYGFNYWQFLVQVKGNRYIVFISQDDIFNKYFIPKMNDMIKITGYLSKDKGNIFGNDGAIKNVSHMERVISKNVGGFNIVF